MLSLSYDKNKRRRNDGGRTSSIPQESRVELIHTQEREERKERLSLCSEVALWRCLFRPTRKGGGNHRRLRNQATREGPIKNRASSIGWQGTAKKFYQVARSLRRQPGKLMRDGPKSLPDVSIHIVLSYGKAYDYVLCIENWVCVESVCISMKDNNPICYVYTLSDPRDESIHYVGTSRNPKGRWYQHNQCRDGNQEKNLWIQELKQHHLKPKLTIIESIEGTSRQAWQREKHWIKFYTQQSQPLTNKPNTMETFFDGYGTDEWDLKNRGWVQHEYCMEDEQ